jgi:hypothetical protein
MAWRKRSVSSAREGCSASQKRSLLSAKISSVTESAGRKGADKSIFCPHCDSSLSSKTFRRHKSLYFDLNEGTWTKLEQRSEILSSNTG